MRYHPASGATLETLVTTLKGKLVRSTRFVSIGSGTSGTVALPANSTVILDDFGGTVDAVVTQITSGKPNQIAALTASGAVVATTFDASGNWAFTGTPSAYPVAIVYRVYQTLENFDSSSSDIVDVTEFHEILPPANGGTGTSTVFTAGSVVFAGASGVYAQDNTGIFYDDSTNSLGLGTASPTSQLQLDGAMSAAAWTSGGIGIVTKEQTFTDTTSTGSPSSIIIHRISAPTVAATNAITPSEMTTLTVSAPVDGTNVVSSDASKFAFRAIGNARITGSSVFGTNSVNPVSVIQIDGNRSDTSWTTTGKNFSVASTTLTDTSGSGTINDRVSTSYNNVTFASSSAVTITRASNVYLLRPPSAGTNTSITNSIALYIPGGSVDGTPTNTYGLNVNSSTGGTNNYAATFSGFVGMGGVTDPLNPLCIAASAAVLGTNEQICLRSNREAIIANEIIGGISFRSNDSTLTAPGTVVGLFDMIASATHTASVLDSAFVWHTTSTLTMAERMRLTAAGNLGVGTTSPQDLLHVSTAASNSLQLPIRLQNLDTTGTGGSAVGLAFKIDSTAGNNYYKAGIAFERAASDGRGTLHFLQNTDGNSSNATLANSVMSILRTGLVGIGITAPVTKLHLDSGDATATAIKLTAGTTTGQTATDGCEFGIDTAGAMELRQREALDMIFLTNNTEALRIKSAGNIQLPTTVTAGGTTGNQTINKTTGTVNFAAGATAITVTNSLVATTSIVLPVVRTNDTTADIKNVVPGAGSFVINLNAAATAETSVGFVVIN